MPVWMIVLLFLPLGLWLAYCVLKGALGLPGCGYCRSAWFGAGGALGLWLLWSGWSEGVALRMATGGTILFVVIVVGGALHLASRLEARKKRRRQAETLAPDPTVPIIAGVAAGAALGGRPDDEAAPDIPEAPDLDVGGFDI